jgi:hypothetical protein
MLAPARKAQANNCLTNCWVTKCRLLAIRGGLAADTPRTLDWLLARNSISSVKNYQYPAALPSMR